MSGIGVITNPRSRQNRRNPALARRLAYILGERGLLEQPTDLDALDRVALQLKDREIDVVAINGGDGTSHVVLSALVRAYGDAPLPQIALLRGGTMNTVARGLGISGSPQELLGRLTALYHRDEPMASVQRNLLRVGDQAGFLFGNGVISNFLEAYYEGSEPTPARAAWLLTRAVASTLVQGKLVKRLSRPLRARVLLDGRELPDFPWIALAAGTVDDIGLGFRPFYKAPGHPGAMHAVGFGCTPGQLVPDLWNIYRARATRHPRIVDGLCRVMEIESLDAQPLNFMIDGDFHRGGQRLEVRVGPRVQMLTL